MITCVASVCVILYNNDMDMSRFEMKWHFDNKRHIVGFFQRKKCKKRFNILLPISLILYY